MKLIMQIALGVFLGSLASHFAFDTWHTRQEAIAKETEEKLRAERQRMRDEQAERIRALLMQGRQGKNPGKVMVPPGFVPDDAQELPQFPGAE
jgi:hypothetical protein